MSRNAVFDALMAIGAAIKPGGIAWGETGRRYKSPDQCQLPALFQVETEEMVSSQLGKMIKRKIAVTWVVYHSSGLDQASVPARFTADALEAIQAALEPLAANDRMALGGLAYAVMIDGSIRRFPGDVDGVEIVTIPIVIILP